MSAVVADTSAVARARAGLAAARERAPEVDLAALGAPTERVGWSLWPDAMRLLAALVEALRPAHVLELGSGLSTLLLARACAAHAPGCRITSIDSDPDHSADVAERLAADGVGVPVTQQLAPIVLREYGGEVVPVYRLDSAGFATAEPPDLVLVDGPPEPLGGREGTLYQLLPLARPGTMALLDDAARPSERTALAHWGERLGDAIELHLLDELTGGMAAALVREPLAREELWPRRVQAAAAAIAAAVPQGAAVALVDDGVCGDEVAPGARVFNEREGVYRGAPADDAEALAELVRVRSAGARWLALVWPAFWWLDCYEGFAAELRSRPPLAEDGNVVVFDLTRP